MTTEFLQQRLRAFIDESCRESAHRVCPTADFHKVFLAENPAFSRQAVRAAMRDIGFERTWLQMIRRGKSRVTAVYMGLELMCEVPVETDSLQSDEISLQDHNEPEVEFRTVKPTIEFYTREMMPSIVAQWRKTYADNLMSCAIKYRDRLRDAED